MEGVRFHGKRIDMAEHQHRFRTWGNSTELSFRFHCRGSVSLRQPWLLGGAHISVWIVGLLRLSFQQESKPSKKWLQSAVSQTGCDTSLPTR